jgi:hypothetical protein
VKLGPKLAKSAKGPQAELKHIWPIVPGHPAQPGTWYARVDDAAALDAGRGRGCACIRWSWIRRAGRGSGWVGLRRGILHGRCGRNVDALPADKNRVVPEGALKVWRPRDGGRRGGR